MLRIRSFMMLSLIVLPCAAMAAQNQAEVTLVYPCRAATAPVQVDGTLDAAEWGSAIVVSGFRDSGSQKLFAEQVTMQLLYDHQNLYLGVKCSESNMPGLKTPTTDRDGAFWNDDALEFFLDAKHDHEHYWQFAATAKAVRYDNQDGDSNWNGDWKVAARCYPDAWTIEVAIPFAELRLSPPSPGTVWGFNLCREREAGGKLELANWADVQRKFQNPPLFGHLLFVDSNWQPSAASIAPVSREAGGKETRIYVNDGYWRVTEEGKPELFTYRALLHGQGQAALPQMEELRGIYKDKPQMALREDFKRLDDSFGDIGSLIAGDAPVGPERYASAKAFLDNLSDRVESIYWRVRLALLNETM